VTGDDRPGGILHVVASTDRRGAETAAVDLVAALRTLGQDGVVVALAPGEVGGLDLPVLGRTRFSARGLAELRRHSRLSTVVVAHGSSTLPAVAAATLGTGVPFVYRSIGDPRAWVTTAARRARVRAAVARASAVVALWSGSAVTWHEVLGVPAPKLHVIPNAAWAADFSPADETARRTARVVLGLEPDATIALYLGALSPEKRADLAIDAIARLDDVELIVVGDGPERARLEEMAVAVAPSRVHFLGQTPHPQGALNAADMVVLPSDTEGQPRVAVEAGLCGLPVVATRVGGLSEVIEDGSTGLLVSPGNASQLAEAMRTALAARWRMGEAAHRRCAARFDLSTVAQQWQTLLKSVRWDTQAPPL
jgi:glycosyltransferase involved in cell wall biosynthesis